MAAAKKRAGRHALDRNKIKPLNFVVRISNRLRGYYKIHNAMNHLLLKSYDVETKTWKDNGDHHAFLVLEKLDEGFRKGELNGTRLTRKWNRRSL